MWTTTISGWRASAWARATRPCRPSCRKGSEKRAPIDAADQRIDQVFGMRHQPEHVESIVEYASYGMGRAVGVGRVADPSLGVEVAERDPSVGLDSLDR